MIGLELKVQRMTGPELKVQREAAGARLIDVARALGYTRVWIHMRERTAEPLPDPFVRAYLAVLEPCAMRQRVRLEVLRPLRAQVKTALRTLRELGV